MGLYKFSIAAAASPSDIETKITSVRGQGANIYLHTIIDIGNLNLSINNKNVTINYDLIGTKQNSLFNWYICDTVGYETIIILYNSGTESDSTFGLANYNRIYFNVKNQLVSNPKISETLAAQFNVLRGRFDSYESDGSNDDVIMLTKCVYNDGSNIEIGEAVVADNLYVSTNLRSTSFKTIVKDENNKQFINVGGIFYLPYSEEIIYPSWSEKQWILPPGTVDYEWHPATVIVSSNYNWWDSTKSIAWYKNGWAQQEPCLLEKNKNFFLDVDYTPSEDYPLIVKDFVSNLKDIKTVYFVIKSKRIGENYLFINGNTDSYGTSISAIDEKSFLIKPKKDNNWIVSKSPLNFHIFAVKISLERLLSSREIIQSYWIDGKFEKTLVSSSADLFISSGNGNNQVGIRNCNIKYFAIVEHDQTSEEIVKTSQLLMDKFDIH